MSDAFSLEENMKIIEEIFKFFTSPILSPRLFDDILSVCLEGRPDIPRNENQKSLTEIGYLGIDDFKKYFSKINKKGIPVPVLYTVLNCLERERILTEFNPLEVGGVNRKTVYLPNREAILNILGPYSTQAFINLLLGFEFIVRKAKRYTLKIEVKNKHTENFSIGTGFLTLRTSQSRIPLHLVITNKHVVEHADSISIFNEDNEELDYTDLRMSEDEDIALIILKKQNFSEALYPNMNPKILDEIVTVGFPKIPMAKDAYIVAHKGEVNSFVQNFWSKDRFLISARTSPGNSGSPILDRTGYFIGMVTELLFEQESFKEKGILPYYAGIPAASIINYIDYCFPARFFFG